MLYVVLLAGCKALQMLFSGLNRQVITENYCFVIRFSDQLLEHCSRMARLKFGHW
jgi:hypothetical protein